MDNTRPATRIRRIAMSVVTAICLTFQTAAAGAASIEDVLLKEDWSAVSAIQPASDVPHSIHRFLVGHARLLTNANDQSLCDFLLAGQDDTTASWLKWTTDLRDRWPGSAVASYLFGDALARQGRLDEAASALDRALVLDPDHAASLNARAVVSAAQGRWDDAAEDLDAALELNPALADALANMGMLYIQRRLAPKAAEGWFRQALAVNPDFALAQNGLGAALAAQHQWDSAEQLFMDAAGGMPCANVASINLASLTAHRAAAAERDASVLLAQVQPGVSLHNRLSATQGELRGVRDVAAATLDQVMDDVRHSPQAQAADRARRAVSLADQNRSLTSQIGTLSLASVPFLAASQAASIVEVVIPHPGVRAAAKTVGAAASVADVGLGLQKRHLEQRLANNNRLLHGALQEMHKHNAEERTRAHGVPGMAAAPSGTPGGGGICCNMCCDGGVRGGVPKSTIDPGDWPVVTWPGLAYAVLPAAAD